MARRTTIAQREAPTAFISEGLERKETPIFTGTFGSSITDRFRMASTFITRMGTRLITQWETLNANLGHLTCAITYSVFRVPSAKRRLNGTAQQSVANGIRRWLGRLGEFASSFGCIVKIAAGCSGPGQLTVALAFAPMPARLRAELNLASITRLEPVSSAGKNSRSTDTPPPVPAPEFVRVVSSPKPNGTARVYDLSVDGAHEFYANGVLVHNCTDLMRYIEIENPSYIETARMESVQPVYQGVSY